MPIGRVSDMVNPDPDTYKKRYFGEVQQHKRVNMLPVSLVFHTSGTWDWSQR